MCAILRTLKKKKNYTGGGRILVNSAATISRKTNLSYVPTRAVCNFVFPFRYTYVFGEWFTTPVVRDRNYLLLRKR